MSKPCSKPCPEGKVCNTITGRCINPSRNTRTLPLQCSDNLTLNGDELIEQVRKSVEAYYNHGGRSNAKLNLLHSYIACSIKMMCKKINSDLAKDIHVFSLPGKEEKVKGLFYDKTVDIAVKHKKNVIGIVSVKFAMGNYQQNENNYFEALLGECINLKLADDKRIFWYVFFVYDKVPYFTKDYKVAKYETFTGTKYKKLHENRNDKLLPDALSLTILTNNENIEHPKTMSNDQLVTLLQNIHLKISKYSSMSFSYNLHSFCMKLCNSIKLHAP